MYVGSVAGWGSDFRLSSLGLILLAVAGRAKRGTQYTAVCALRTCAEVCFVLRPLLDKRFMLFLHLK